MVSVPLPFRLVIINLLLEADKKAMNGIFESFNRNNEHFDNLLSHNRKLLMSLSDCSQKIIRNVRTDGKFIVF